MKLGIGERLILLQTLPHEGDIISIKIIRDLQSALGLSEEDIAQAGIKFAGEKFTDPKGQAQTVPDGQVHWDSEIEKEVEIGPKATAIIVSALEELNKEKKLTEAYISVYEKFIPGG